MLSIFFDGVLAIYPCISRSRGRITDLGSIDLESLPSAEPRDIRISKS